MNKQTPPLLEGPLQELGSMEELIEELSLGSARGGAKRPAAPLKVEVVRALTPDDLAAIAAAPPVGALPSIPEIRHQHHQLAGLLARGISNSEISLITGYSPSYISILRNAPDMQELIAYYSEQAEERTVDGLARLRQLGISGVEELQRRVNEEPEKFSVGQLTELVELGLLKPLAAAAGLASARSGGASGGIQINLNFKEPAASASGSTIDVTPREAAE
jgi:hypothetical protein